MHVYRADVTVMGPLEKIMKIGPLDAKPIAAPPSDRKATATAAKGSPAKAGGSTEVNLSPAASQIADAVASDPTFDAQKVESIANAIRDGKFTVDPNKIADKLIANAQDLLKRAKKN
jgi:negative regulator of flagellin synthesis FlgM